MVWRLYDGNKRLARLFPQDADGLKPVVDRLLELPSLHHDKVIDAQPSADNDIFPIPERLPRKDDLPDEEESTD
ncbi:hypothetical protein WI38_16255 [Burkholderia ubonensis]|uniref:Uncharacterized protein n=1 Tax=Burkholderia ubonensis TaxID=101571 RepID=A0A102K614_9BURK|nr:hypothetical protein [Burkholderia ubonensis]KUZ69368.1 hypothetical protein WI35_01550 [Burkholderia ubonensis]KUZ89704.1 hypothetical protein WI38_16255 [Burkholderia ubonensis]KVA03476.1 hypothetical protein WI39_31490 [Burkholderia ubonensis]